VGLKHPTIAPYGAFTCADGRDVVISIQNEREWADFCQWVLLRPDLLEDARCKSNSDRVENREFVDGLVASVFATISSGDLVDRLMAAQTAFGQVNSVYDLIQHPQLRTRRMQVHGKNVDVPALPWVTEWDGDIFPSAPDLNQHGEQLRKEFGCETISSPMCKSA
jgi:itaconate CoA-transferase